MRMRTLWLAVALTALVIGWHEWRMFTSRSEARLSDVDLERRIAASRRSAMGIAESNPDGEYMSDIMSAIDDAHKAGVTSGSGFDSAVGAARAAGKIRTNEQGAWADHVQGMVKMHGGAVKAAGLPALVPHDMRRSAARNLIRAGVSEGVVMKLCGWSTRSMLVRYDVTAAQDLNDGVERLGDFLAKRGHARPAPTAVEG